MKNKYFKDFNRKEVQIGFNSMRRELKTSPQWIKNLFNIVWKDFVYGKFSYDGATFVPERYCDTYFEVASLIHDWFNANGYVGTNVDKIFVIIMEKLNYNKFHIRLRKCLMFFTPLNVLRHKYLKTYKGDIKITNYIK